MSDVTEKVLQFLFPFKNRGDEQPDVVARPTSTAEAPPVQVFDLAAEQEEERRERGQREAELERLVAQPRPVREAFDELALDLLLGQTQGLSDEEAMQEAQRLLRLPESPTFQILRSVVEDPIGVLRGFGRQIGTGGELTRREEQDQTTAQRLGMLFGGFVRPPEFTEEELRTPLAALTLSVPVAGPAFNFTRLGLAQDARALNRGMDAVLSIGARTAYAAQESTVIQPSIQAANVFGVRPITAGLTKSQRLKNLAIRTVNVGAKLVGDARMAEDIAVVQPALMERRRILQVADNMGNLLGAQVEDAARRVFQWDSKGLIQSLKGVEPGLPTPPTIQHVAARLPIYAKFLTPEQLGFMRTLRERLRPFRDLFDEVGLDIRGTRRDIIKGFGDDSISSGNGGFYVPRGNAIEEGLDEAIKITVRGRGGKAGFERVATVETQPEGIAAGFTYARLTDVISGYVKDMGRRVADQHLVNYFKTLTDLEGNLLAQTAADRVDLALRSRVVSLRNRISGRLRTLLRQSVRATTLERQAGRGERGFEAAAGRRLSAEERIAARQAGFTRDDLVQTRRDLAQSIRDVQSVAFELGANVQKIRVATGRLTSRERELERAAKSVTTALDDIQREAESIATSVVTTAQAEGTVAIPSNLGASIRGMERLLRRAERAGEKIMDDAIAASERLDELIGEGKFLKELQAGDRENIIGANRKIRQLMAKESSINALRREVRMLEREENRLLRGALRDITRAERATQQQRATSEALDNFKRELNGLASEWEAEIAHSRITPRDRGLIDQRITGLQGTSFPLDIANAANKVLRDEGLLQGAGAAPTRVVAATNTLLRGIRSTLDLSPLGIQGLVGLAADPVAYGKALKVMVKGFFDDIVLGSFVNNFDEAARFQGRLRAQDWATMRLRIGGAQTEFQLGQGPFGKISRIPLIRGSNRAFGNFGDALRLSWADDMLRNEMKSGRALKEIAESGDLERIAEVVNNMTGYSFGRAFGSVGDIVLFAPRFLQSRLETITKAAFSVRPGATLDQRLARKSLLKMVGYGAALTWAINWALGNETDTRPFVEGKYNSNFMRIRVGDRDFSLFGTWDSIVRAIILTGQGHPEQVVRSMGSGVVSISWDLISGRSFVGEEVRNDPVTFAKWLFESIAPFSIPGGIESVAEIGGGVQEERPAKVAGGVVGILAEVVGGKNAPLSFRDIRDRVALEKYGVRYDQLTEHAIEQGIGAKGLRDIVNADPRIQERIAEFEDKADPEMQISNAFDNWEREKLRMEEDLTVRLKLGVSGAPLREAIQSLKEDRFKVSQAVFGSPEIQQAFDEKAGDDQPLADVLAEEYWSAPVEVDPLTGVADFDGRDTIRQDVLRRAEDAGVSLAYIMGEGEGAYRSRRFADPMVQQAVLDYEKDQQLLQAYWDVPKLLIGDNKLLQAQYDKYQELRATSRAKADNYRKSRAQLAGLLGDITERRKWIRDASLTINDLLLKWYPDIYKPVR